MQPALSQVINHVLEKVNLHEVKSPALVRSLPFVRSRSIAQFVWRALIRRPRRRSNESLLEFYLRDFSSLKSRSNIYDN